MFFQFLVFANKQFDVVWLYSGSFGVPVNEIVNLDSILQNTEYYRKEKKCLTW